MTGHEKFRYLEHTADAKFQAFGATLAQAFAHAALAMASLMWDPETVAESHDQEIRVSGTDPKQLLMAFLEEILFLLGTRGFLLHAAEDVLIRSGEQGLELTAVLKGDEGTGKYDIFGDVKAVTYNDMEIVTGKAPMVQVVVDM